MLRLSLSIMVSLSIVLGPARLVSYARAQTSSTGNVEAEKIRKEVEKLGLGGELTVVWSDGHENYGALTAVGPDDFKVLEVDLQQIITIRYDQVKKVRKGYGRLHPARGKRSNPKKGWIFGAALLGTLFILVLVAVRQEQRQY